MWPGPSDEQPRRGQRERKRHDRAVHAERVGTAGRAYPPPRAARGLHVTARPPAAPGDALTAGQAVGGQGQDMTVPRSTVPLVGRAAELSALTAVVASASAAAPGVVILGGDAGVGKTRLLSELIASASADGVWSLVGPSVDLGDTPPPYLPFTEAFTRLAAEHPEIADAVFDGLPALSRLLPGRAAPTQVPVDRCELFDSVLGALVGLAAERPVALLIEDVHWADQATRDLLGFLFTRLHAERIAIIVSYRSDYIDRRHPLLLTL